MKIKYTGSIIYYIAFVVIQVLPIIGVFYCHFKGDDLERNLYIIYSLIVLIVNIRQIISYGRVFEMDENGCTIKFLFFKARRYKWSEFKTIRLEDNSQRLFGRGVPYKKCVVFSTRENFHTPEMIDILTYMELCLRPFRFFVVFFKTKTSTEVGVYEVDEELFMSTMKEFGVEVQK